MNGIGQRGTSASSKNSILALPLVYRATTERRHWRIYSKVQPGVVRNPWPSIRGNLHFSQSGKSSPKPVVTQFDAPPPSSTHKRLSCTTKTSSAVKKLKLSGLIANGKLVETIPGSPGMGWKTIHSTPSLPTTLVPKKLNRNTSSQEEELRVTRNDAALKRRFPNPLVDLLRSRADLEQTGTTHSQVAVESDLTAGDGFQTPRSTISEIQGRSSPPRLARSTGMRPRMETPLSAARIRIQSPAPSRQSFVERVDFVLS